MGFYLQFKFKFLEVNNFWDVVNDEKENFQEFMYIFVENIQNIGTLFQSKNKQQMKEIQAEGTDNTVTNEGADTRVEIFIITVIVVCGGLLVGSTVVLVLWAKKSWKTLKESNAYAMLKNSS